MRIDTIVPPVLDASSQQVALGCSCHVITKVEGTARGGVLLALAGKFALPVHAIGVGDGKDDLYPFEADAFARSVVGLETRPTGGADFRWIDKNQGVILAKADI